VRDRVLRAQEDASEVHRHDAVPLLGSRVDDGPLVLDRRVVDDDVEAAVPPHDVL
jgi:hypothetical protein